MLARRDDGSEEIRGIVAGMTDDGLLVHDLDAQVDGHGRALARIVTSSEWTILRVS